MDSNRNQILLYDYFTQIKRLYFELLMLYGKKKI